MINKVVELKVGNNIVPLTCYVPSTIERNIYNKSKPAVLILPGGGYVFTYEGEGEPIALRLISQGIAAFVLNYSVKPNLFPQSLAEALTAIKFIRDNSDCFGINPNNISVMGFSAGGHLAGCTGTLWEHASLDPFIDNDRSQYRPDKLILSYPVLKSTGRHHDGSFRSILGEFYNEESLHVVDLPKQVKDNTPPSFIWHTFEDNGVPVDSSIEFGKALLDKNILFEMHIYPHGGHGLCLDDHTTWDVKFGKRSEVSQWIDDAIRFIFDESIIYKS